MTKAPRYSIILAAGKGTRMQSASCHKVCFPVDGVPAINRAITVYRQCGIARHIVVVGSLAGQVVETVGKVFSNVQFTYQAEQAGTADAARTGLRALAEASDSTDVLLVAGDRIIEPTVLERLFDLFYSEECALALITTPGSEDSSQARILETPDGTPLAIVETADISQRQVFADLRERAARESLTTAEVRSLIRDGFARRGVQPSDTKLRAAFGALWEAVTRNEPEPADWLSLAPERLGRFEFGLPGGSLWRQSPNEVRRIRWMNNSVYVLKVGALRHALSRLDRDNAQKEEYLSAILEILARDKDRFRIRALRVDRPDYVLGYNDPAELLEVESILRARKQGRQACELEEGPSYRPVAAWRAEFEAATDGSNSGASAL
ncbi:MAG TPA: NTP transferase domain-containing protein, partial [Verrucomicrobiae bacterium]